MFNVNLFLGSGKYATLTTDQEKGNPNSKYR